uniref:NAD(P)(+)--arginine ADP-ribosyltransferase n=1 Tax=Arcella intermedia TaxID=1963864 RepID=A0A6B2L116_9EUKA
MEIEADEDTYINKGDSLYMLQKFKKAIKCYDQVLSKNSNQKYALCEKGNALLELGKHKQAILCFQQVLKMDKTFKEAWNNQGNAFFALGKYEDALGCYCQFVLLDHFDKDGIFNIGNTLKKLGQDEEAEKYLNRSKAVNKGDTEVWWKSKNLDSLMKKVWMSKGISLYQSKKFKKSNRCFEKVLRVDDEEIDIWNWKGRTLYKMEEYREAVQCFRKSLHIDNNNATTWVYLGKVFCASNSFTQGLKCFKKALKIDQNHPKALKALILVENARLLFYYEDIPNELQLEVNVPTSDIRSLKGAVKRGLQKFNEEYWIAHKSEWIQAYKEYKHSGGTMTYPEHVSIQLYMIIHPHFKLFSELNKSLFSWDGSSHWGDYLAYFQSALTKTKTFQEKREIYRGVPHKLISKYKDKYCCQKMITWPAFYSATTSMGTVFNLIKYGTVFIISNCSGCPLLKEDEVLIPKGSTFKITNILEAEPFDYIHLHLIHNTSNQ